MASSAAFDFSSLRSATNATILLTSLVVAAVYLVQKAASDRRLTDAKGHKIPDGPAGLPIVGKWPSSAIFIVIDRPNPYAQAHFHF